MMSYLETTWKKLPPHLSRRIAREREALPSNGDPKVMQRTEGVEETDWREERSQRAQSEAVVPPIEWPVITMDLLFSVRADICTTISSFCMSLDSMTCSERTNMVH